MAAKLQCEICGGKLVGKPGGIFECESCGTEYSTEWAKAKIQEIKGTVKVEGTVDVKGSVQVEGPVKVEGAANAQSLIKRGNLALEDGKWDDAKICFNDVLKIEPENAEAYLGIGLANIKVCGKKGYATSFINGGCRLSYIDERRINQFANEEMKAWFDELDKKKSLKEEEQRKDELAASLEAKKRLTPIREYLNHYQSFVTAAAGISFGVNEDGSVVSVGRKRYAEIFTEWTDIVTIASCTNNTVGLKRDGTVVAVGAVNHSQCNVSGWRDIESVATSNDCILGIKSDGTAIALGSDKLQSALSALTDSIAVSEGYRFAIVLKSDGTVVLSGDNRQGRINVSDWTDIVAISAGFSHAVGLRTDGRVVATGLDREGCCGVDTWRDIVAISAGYDHTVGLKSNGTVVATCYTGDIKEYKGQCDVKNWKDIVTISAGYSHTIGLKSDGTVVATGNNDEGQCNVSDWKLFKTDEEKESDYKSACAAQNFGTEVGLKTAIEIFSSISSYKNSAEHFKECKATLLNMEKKALSTELSNLRGMFTGKRRKQIEARLVQIDSELKRLK